MHPAESTVVGALRLIPCSLYTWLPRWVIHAPCISYLCVTVIRILGGGIKEGKGSFLFYDVWNRAWKGSSACTGAFGKDFILALRVGPRQVKNQSLCDLPKPSGNNLLTICTAYLWKGPQAQPKARGLVFKAWCYREHCRLQIIPFFYLGSPLPFRSFNLSSCRAI